MSVFKGRRGKEIAGRRLACFAAAFSAVLFCLCYNIRSLDRGIVWSAAELVIAFTLIADTRHVRRAAAIVIAAGVAATALFGLRVYPSYKWAESVSGREIDFEVTVTEYPNLGSYYVVCDGRMEPDGQKVTVLVYEPIGGITPGDVISGRGTAAIQEDEYFASSAAEGRYITIKVKSGAAEVKSRDSLPFKYFPKHLSRKIRQEIMWGFKEDDGSLVSALLTGSKEDMSRGLKNALSLSGTSHIVSVSGMHVGIIASVLVYFLGKRHGAIAAVPLMVFFGLITGMNPPVIRAIFMSGIALSSFYINRQNDTVTTVMCALLIMLVLQPESVLSVSLQLSFSAVLGILLLYKPISRTVTAYLPLRFSENKAGHFVINSLAISLAASLGSFTVSVFYFDRLSIIAPFTNLLVIWMVPVMMALGFVYLLFSMILGIELKTVSLALKLLLDIFIYIVRLFASFGFSSVSTHDFLALGAVALVGGFLIFGYLIRPKLRVAAICGLAAALVISVLSSHYMAAGRAEVYLTGSGLMMVRHGGDIAAFMPADGVDKYMMNDYLDGLYYWGESRADAVFFSRINENWISLDDMASDSFYYPEGNVDHRAVSYFNGGDKINVGDISAEVIDTGKGCGFYITVGPKSFLWIGDIKKGKLEPAGSYSADMMVLGKSTVKNNKYILPLLEGLEAGENIIVGGNKEEEDLMDAPYICLLKGGEKRYSFSLR